MKNSGYTESTMPNPQISSWVHVLPPPRQINQTNTQPLEIPTIQPVKITTHNPQISTKIELSWYCIKVAIILSATVYCQHPEYITRENEQPLCQTKPHQNTFFKHGVGILPIANLLHWRIIVTAAHTTADECTICVPSPTIKSNCHANVPTVQATQNT